MTVVQAIPKGERAELAVEVLTEVGVDRIVPWAAARCVGTWRGDRAAKSLARWRATARESGKQSRRTWLPEVTEMATTAEVAAMVGEADLAVVLHEDAVAPMSSLDLDGVRSILVVVGPEGGITDEELAAARRCARRTDGGVGAANLDGRGRSGGGVAVADSALELRFHRLRCPERRRREGKPVIAGRYTLEREVGRGGMGVVWLARDEVLGRLVAMKRVGMFPGGSDPDLERAAREARLAATLNHPHVVAVFDLVTDGDEQWLVMEYVDCVTLGGLVKRDGPLSPDHAAHLVGQAAQALAAAHAAGIVHRDVKPANILVTAADQVKLTDFGIARAVADASLTQTGLVTGSPSYLAPEVASGSKATNASDTWSLGATLFHALAGHPPYEVTENPLGTLYKIINEDPPRLADAGWLAPVLESTMAKDPEDRWSMERVRDVLAMGPTATPQTTQQMGLSPAWAGAADDDRTRTMQTDLRPRA